MELYFMYYEFRLLQCTYYNVPTMYLLQCTYNVPTTMYLQCTYYNVPTMYLLQCTYYNVSVYYMYYEFRPIYLSNSGTELLELLDLLNVFI